MNIQDAVTFTYKNFRGETSKRVVRPISITHDYNKWHGEQWLLRAMDLEKEEIREFAMKDIKDWKPITVRGKRI